ncbi:MAG: hypothetical protein JWO94_255, partial [Verrucomicrobiaceae bacterium]|nr:hypothetical protein [Verrucomicrobiaceae bacterium]
MAQPALIILAGTVGCIPYSTTRLVLRWRVA